MKKGLEKKLSHFIKDESGKISKGKVLKMGLATIAILSSLDNNAFAQATHTNTPPSVQPTPTEDCATLPVHSNHASHSSY